MPATKSLRSGTWARTLLPMTRSAWPPLAHEALGEVARRRTPSASGRRAPRRPRRRCARARRRGPGIAAGDEVLEQVAVVARQLDDEAVPAEAEALDHRVGVLPRVLHPAVGEGREVGVLAEDVLAVDVAPAAARAGTRGRSGRGAGRTAPSVDVLGRRRTISHSGCGPRSTNVSLSGAPQKRHATETAVDGGWELAACWSPAERIVRRRHARTGHAAVHRRPRRRSGTPAQWKELLLNVTPEGRLPCVLKKPALPDPVEVMLLRWIPIPPRTGRRGPWRCGP